MARPISVWQVKDGVLTSRLWHRKGVPAGWHATKQGAIREHCQRWAPKQPTPVGSATVTPAIRMATTT